VYLIVDQQALNCQIEKQFEFQAHLGNQIQVVRVAIHAEASVPYSLRHDTEGPSIVDVFHGL